MTTQVAVAKHGRLVTSWKAFKHALAYAVIRLLYALASLLPEGIVFAFGSLVGRLLCLTPLRAQALANIRNAFGTTAPSERFPTSESLATASIMHLGELFAEMLLLDRWQPTLLNRCTMAPNIVPLVKECLSRGKGLVMATGHIGNWELYARALHLSDLPFCTVAKAAFDPRVARFIVEWRARGGVTALNRGEPGSIKAILRRLRQSEGIGMLLDVDTDVSSVWVPFFGQPAKTPSAAADLALKMDAPIVIGWTWREGRGRFATAAQELPVTATGDKERDAQEVTAAINRVLEAAIRAHPEQWLWSQRRWKSPPPQGNPAQ